MVDILLINPKDDISESAYDSLVDLRHMERKLEDSLFLAYMDSYFKEKNIQTHFREYPYMSNLGLLSIAAYCRNDGHYVRYIQDEAVKEEELIAAIRNARIIGISIMTSKRKRSIELVKLCSKTNPGALLIAGGPEINLCGYDLCPGIDVYIKGAGEKVISLVASKGISVLHDCIGVKFRTSKSGEYIEKAGVNEINIKFVPIPAYDLIEDIEKTQIYLETSRGCNYSCSFCVEHAKVQSKTYEQIRDMLITVEQLRQHSTIHIIDSDFLNLHGGAELFYRAVEEVKPTNYFIIQARAQRITKEKVLAMYSHNIVDLYLGIETFSDQILKKVRKDVTYKEIKEALTILRDYAPNSVAYRGNFIQGLPGENKYTAAEDYMRRKEILSEGLLTIMRDYVFMPLEGSHIYNYPELYGIYLPNKYKPSFRNCQPSHWYKDWSKEDIYQHQCEMIKVKLHYIEKMQCT